MERVKEALEIAAGLEPGFPKPVEPEQVVTSKPDFIKPQEAIELTESKMPAIERTNQILKEINEEWGDDPYGYQWPASRLSRNEMARLTIVSNTVKRPLNQLIKEACDFYANAMLKELGYEIPTEEA